MNSAIRILTIGTLIFFIQVMLSLPLSSSLEARDLTGLEIMTRVDQREDGDDQTSEANFELMNKRGQKRIRDTIRLWKDYDGKSAFDAKMITFFKSPPDVKGTGFLSWSYEDENKDDDQWLYLPALRKVRRIAAGNKGNYFMGTDFTYDDMGERKVEEDEHKLLKRETHAGFECYVIESTPKKKGYIYSKKLTWVDKKNWLPLKVDYYDRKKKFLKTLKTEWQLVDGIWTWKRSEMKNHQTGHKTIIAITSVKMNTGLKDRDFTARMLKRGSQ